MLKLRKILFRADGNSLIGLGHVIRSLALADMLREDFDCHFYIRRPSESLIKEIENICNDFTALPDTITYEDEAVELSQTLEGDEIIVLDGYHFTTDYQQTLKLGGHKLVCIDDIHPYHFVADIIINHALGSKKSDYSTEFYTKTCLGLKYALLRKSFLTVENSNIVNKEKAAFVCFGGADIYNATCKAIEKLLASKLFDKIYIIIGSAYLHQDILENYRDKESIEIYRHVSANEMVDLMQRTEIGICAASTICYEYLCVGGFLYVEQTAENQKDIFNHLIQTGVATDFRDFPAHIKPNNQLAFRKDIIDKEGINRFKKLFTGLSFSLTLRLKRAAQEEAGLYYKWANDPVTRSASFHSNYIQWEDHLKWFADKTSNPNTVMYTFYSGLQPVGQVRFEMDNSVAISNYSVDPQFRTHGAGRYMLIAAIEKLRKEKVVKTILGYVKCDNIASVRIFESLNFQVTPAENYSNSYCYSLNIN